MGQHSLTALSHSVLLILLCGVAWAKKLESVDWSEVRPGDVVTVGGVHRSAEGKALPFRIGASGTKERPIIIKGDAQNPAQFFGYYLSADNRNWFTIQDIDFCDSGQFRAINADGVKFDNCVFIGLRNDNIRLIEPHVGNNDWTVTNCWFSDVPNAVYSRCTGDAGAERITVQNCMFENIGATDPRAKDGHAVGIQAGSGHRIIGNWTMNTGTAICCWAPIEARMCDVVIANNVIIGAHAAEISMGTGIGIEGRLPKAGLRRDIVIRDNVIDSCDGNGIRVTSRDNVVLTNNKVTRCGLAGVYREKVRVRRTY